MLSASGIRGSDQYWYVADVDSLISGVNKTNHLYSGMIIDNSTYLAKQPFLHNVLTIYMVIPFAIIFGSYIGWIVFNSLSVIIAGIILLLVVDRITGKSILGLYAFGIFLLNPLTIWLASQPLVEASVTPFIAAVVAICGIGVLNVNKYLIIIILLSIANMIRGVFLPAIIFIPFIYLLTNYKIEKKIRLFVYFIMLIITALIFTAIKSIIFKDLFIGWQGILMNGIPGKSNMIPFLYPQSGSVDWYLVFSKFINNIRIQFIPDDFRLLIFYLPFNLIYYLLIRGNKTNKTQYQVFYFALILLIIHLITILIAQNEFRYMFIPLPVALVALIMVFYNKFNISNAMLSFVLLFVVISLFIMSIPLSLQARLDANNDYYSRNLIKQNISKFIQKNDRIVIIRDDTSYSALIAYSLRPIVAINFPINGSSEYFNLLMSKVHPQWLLSDSVVMNNMFKVMKWGEPVIITEIYDRKQKMVLVRLIVSK